MPDKVFIGSEAYLCIIGATQIELLDLWLRELRNTHCRASGRCIDHWHADSRWKVASNSEIAQ